MAVWGSAEGERGRACLAGLESKIMYVGEIVELSLVRASQGKKRKGQSHRKDGWRSLPSSDALRLAGCVFG